MSKESKKGESWRKGFQQGIKEEKSAWLKGKRCHSCGRELQKKCMTTDTCGDCFNEE